MAWQDAIAVLLVLTAAAYVLRGLLRFLRRRGMPRCSGCSTCPADDPAQTLVPLDHPARSASDATPSQQSRSDSKTRPAR